MKNIRRVTGSSLRGGMTLVELLVSGGIIAVMLAILLPSIQYARESAREMNCRNNLKQLMLAFHGFESAHQRFPPGTLGFEKAFDYEEHWDDSSSIFFWKRTQHTSSLGLMLPFFEFENARQMADQSLFTRDRFLDEFPDRKGRIVDWYGKAKGFLDIATLDVPLFRCPSDLRDAPPRILAGSQPCIEEDGKVDGFGAIYLSTRLPADYGLTNYLGCAGAYSGGQQMEPIKGPYTGVMSSRERVTFRNVVDGSSNTIVYGETIGYVVDGERIIASPWFIGGLARGRGGIDWMQGQNQASPTLSHLGNWNNSHGFGFGSRHAGTVNITLLDGSVKPLFRALDWRVLYQYCGRADSSASE